MSNVRNYIIECARLFYWIFCKPYTLKAHLKDIHPDLTITDHPYLKLRQYPENKKLRYFAGQVFCLSTITPQLIVLLFGIIYTITTPESFNWLLSESFLIGWIMAQIIFRYGYVLLGNKLFYISLGIFVLLIIVSLSLNNNYVVFGVVYGVLYGVVLGVLLV